MRPEPAPPEEASLDLLAHADALALAATEAIAVGDSVTLAALLEERGIVVAAAIAALKQCMAAPARPEQLLAHGRIRCELVTASRMASARMR